MKDLAAAIDAAVDVGIASKSVRRYIVVVIPGRDVDGIVDYSDPRIFKRSDSVDVARGHARRYFDVYGRRYSKAIVVDSVDGRSI